MDYAQYFTQRELQKIHDASLEILENIGILVHNEKAGTSIKNMAAWWTNSQGWSSFPRKWWKSAARLLYLHIPLQPRILNTIKFCPMMLPWFNGQFSTECDRS